MKSLGPNKKKIVRFITNQYSEYMTDVLGEYFCKTHNSKLKTIDTLRRHLKELHSENNYQTCIYCSKNVKRLNQHYHHCKFIKSKKKNKINNNIIIYNSEIRTNTDLKENRISSNNNEQLLYFTELFKEVPNNVDELYNLIYNRYKSNFLQQINKYDIISSEIIGKGTFGVCCFGLDKNTKKPCVIKFSSEDQYNEELRKESQILRELNDADFFPKIYTFEESEETIPYLAEDILGPNLRKIYEFCERKIDIKTLCNIGIDLISCLNAIHQKGILHRDIKTSNICWNILNNNIIHPDIIIIDYGLAAKEKDSKEEAYPGNYCYAPLEALEGETFLKKHEILSVLLILLYLYKGYLPWKNKFNDKYEKKKKTINLMRDFDFLSELPVEIQEIGEIYKMVKELDNNQELDYIKYQRLLITLMKRQKNDEYKEFRFSWEKKILLLYKEAVEIKNPQVIKDKIYKLLFKGYPKEFVDYTLKKKYLCGKVFSL